MVLPTTLQMASTLWPRRLASRRAASVSAVSPDCVMTSTRVSLFERRVAVAEFAGVFDLDRQVGQFLEQVFAHQRRVPARAAGGDDDAVDRAQFGRRHVQPAEPGRRAVVVDAAAQGVLDRARLLEDFLEHEMRESRRARRLPASNSSWLTWTWPCPVPRF